MFYVIIGIAVAIIVFPIVWTFMTSFKTRLDAFAIPPKILFTPVLTNYRNALFTLNSQIPRSLLNSLIVASAVIIVTFFLGFPAAYAYARLQFVGKRTTSFWILFARMLPPMTMVIPFFVLYVKIDVIDTYLGLILLYTTFSLPLFIWMMISFIEDIPRELEDAAVIDGCSRVQVITRIIIPLTKGGIFAAALFCFLESWNEFLLALLLTSTDARTVQVALYGFITTEETQWGPLTATASIIMLPTIIMGLIFQRYIVRGMTLGAIK